MKETIKTSTEEHTVQVDENDEVSGSVIEVNRRGIAEVHESEMPSGPDVPYDVTEVHSSTSDEPKTDLAREAAEHEVEMRDAKKKAGSIDEDAPDITPPVRSPD